MPKFLVIVVYNSRAQAFEPGHPQAPKIVTEVDDKKKWGLLHSDHTAVVFDRGYYAQVDRHGSVTVIDAESPYEISKAIGNAVGLLQSEMKSLLGISPRA